MQPEQARCVRLSLRRLAPLAGKLGHRIDQTLSRSAPDCRWLFITPSAGRAQELLDTVSQLLDAQACAGGFQQVCAQLVARHAGQGVLEEHYDAMGAALLQALRDCLAEAFTEELEDAWASLYGELAESMMALEAMAGPTTADLRDV